jgi:hypothetical protein
MKIFDKINRIDCPFHECKNRGKKCKKCCLNGNNQLDNYLEIDDYEKGKKKTIRFLRR